MRCMCTYTDQTLCSELTVIHVYYAVLRRGGRIPCGDRWVFVVRLEKHLVAGSCNTMDRVSLAIIGAGRNFMSDDSACHTKLRFWFQGWHGLIMAKTYHEAEPGAHIRILDSASTLGGVWSEERLYEERLSKCARICSFTETGIQGLKTNNVVGSYEFSDYPLRPNRYGLRPGQHIPGTAVHQYLNDAADYFNITRFLQLQTKVISATLNADGTWLISYSNNIAQTSHQIIAEKLVIATGLTSEPHVPYFAGQKSFQRPILHSKQLKARSQELAAAKTAVVLGGNKSAWDVCYGVASRGRQAHMVLRPSGGGPSWIWSLRLWPFNTTISPLSSTRFFSLFDPWPFDNHSFLGKLRRVFHASFLGRWITMCFWYLLGRLVRGQYEYDSNPNIQKLAPWYSLYWMGNSLGVHNYDSDWFELARQGNIQVHIADVQALSEHSVQLSDGSNIDTDALVCCTGWKAEPPIKFFPSELIRHMGIPGSLQAPREVMHKVRVQIIDQRPFLETQAIRTSVVQLSNVDQDSKSGQSSPYSLYRYVVPCHPDFMKAKNLAFMGMHLSVHAVMVAQAQAIWITGFFGNEITKLSPENFSQLDVEYETAFHVEYERLRRPRAAGSHGAGFPDLVFDSVPYVDLLLRDLGLETKRKPGWFSDLFTPYRLQDYRGLVQEWNAVRRPKNSVQKL